jgi:CxxC-x17-CxxC domain-containing protein
MGSFNRDSRGGGRSFGGGRLGGFSRGGFGGGRSFDRGGGRDRGDRQMFDAVCSNCGKDCQVPFRPTGDKPVYCSDCFEKIGGGRSDSPRPERSEFRSPRPSFDSNKGQSSGLDTKLEAMNAKIEKILKLLEPKSTAEVISSLVIEEPKEVKAPKAKLKVKKATSTKKK